MPVGAAALAVRSIFTFPTIRISVVRFIAKTALYLKFRSCVPSLCRHKGVRSIELSVRATVLLRQSCARREFCARMKMNGLCRKRFEFTMIGYKSIRAMRGMVIIW